MREWRIPVTWEMFGIVSIEADTLAEAVDRAYDDDIPAPDDGEYVDGSWEVPDNIGEIRTWYNDNAPDGAADSPSEDEAREFCDPVTEEIGDDIEIEPADISELLQINVQANQ